MNSNFEKADHEIVLLFHLKLNIIYVFYGDDFAVCENQASPGVIDFGYVSGKGVISAALFFGVWNKVGDRDLWALGKLRLKIMEPDVQKLFLPNDKQCCFKGQVSAVRLCSEIRRYGDSVRIHRNLCCAE